MFQDEVEKVELPAIAQLQQLGWRYLPGASLSPMLPIDGAPSIGERGFYRDVVLVKQLEAALRRLNPGSVKKTCARYCERLLIPTMRA